MNATLIAAFARQRLTSPMRLALAFTALVFGLLPVALSGSVSTLGRGSGATFALVFASGLIGQDVASGVLQLTLARPLRRRDYVLSRWLAASLLAIATLAVQFALGLAVALARHGTPDPASAALTLLEGALAAVGVSAVLLLGSSLTTGLGDLGLYVLASIGGAMLGGVATAADQPVLARVAEEVQRFVGAAVPAQAFQTLGSAASTFEIVSWLSTVTLCVALAIHFTDRRELSYAAG